MNCERLTKILMIEADLTTAEALRQHLAQRGFEVDLVRSVVGAVDALAGCEYAAVVLDCSPPDGEPWPILELARTRPRPTPVIMLLAMGDELTARAAQQYGVDNFFVKGAGLTALLPRMVERAIEQSQEHARLRRSETTLAGLLENIPEVLWSITADRQQLIYISPSCAYVYGYSPEDFARNASLAYEAILPEDRAVAEEAGRQIEITRQPGQAEYRIRRSNGAVRWVRVKTIPALDEAGEIVRYDGITADITEQKRAELELAERNLELHVLERVNGTLTAISDIELALGQAVTFFQQGFGHRLCAVYLLERDAQWLSLVASAGYSLPPEKRKLSLSGHELIAQAVSTGRAIHTPEAHYLPSDDQMRAVCVMPLRHGDQIIGALSVESEREGGLSERELAAVESFAHQAAMALTQAASRRQAAAIQERFEDLYHRAPDAYCSFLADGTIVEINDTGAKRLGYEREEMVGRMRLQDLLAENQTAALAGLWEELRERGEAVVESEQVRRDGTIFPARIQARAEYWPGAVGWVGHASMRDLSQEKQLLTQLIQAQKIDSVGRLAGGVAHDFNNLLTAILGFTALAKRQLGREHPTSQSLDEVERAATRAARLVSQLLAYSRQQISRLQPLDLNQLVAETAKFLHRTLPETIRINLRLGDDLQTVKADQNHLHQVLLNLSLNARDAMRGCGELTIETGNAAFDEQFTAKHLGSQPGHYAYLRVTDSGTGIDPAALPRLFEPFFTTKEVGQGAGLGLAMVYGIVKSHGGYITAESEPGEGASFCVYLPACEEEVRPAAVASTAARGGSETIMVVEDEPIVSSLVQKVLTSYGYHVLMAANGREALATYRDRLSGVDLVIADVVMPEMGGPELHREVKKINPQARVLLSSGYSASPELKDCLGQGVPFIQKPYRIEELAQMVREILDG